MERSNSKDLDFYNFILKSLEENKDKPYFKNLDFMFDNLKEMIEGLYKEFISKK